MKKFIVVAILVVFCLLIFSSISRSEITKVEANVIFDGIGYEDKDVFAWDLYIEDVIHVYMQNDKNNKNILNISNNYSWHGYYVPKIDGRISIEIVGSTFPKVVNVYFNGAKIQAYTIDKAPGKYVQMYLSRTRYPHNSVTKLTSLNIEMDGGASRVVAPFNYPEDMELFSYPYSKPEWEYSGGDGYIQWADSSVFKLIVSFYEKER